MEGKIERSSTTWANSDLHQQHMLLFLIVFVSSFSFSNLCSASIRRRPNTKAEKEKQRGRARERERVSEWRETVYRSGTRGYRGYKRDRCADTRARAIKKHILGILTTWHDLCRSPIQNCDLSFLSRSECFYCQACTHISVYIFNNFERNNHSRGILFYVIKFSYFKQQYFQFRSSSEIRGEGRWGEGARMETYDRADIK